MPPVCGRPPWWGLGLLWAAALALAFTGLRHAPLRDWDEAIVARVALELSRHPWAERLLPTYAGQPYLNKPPGLHWLIAALIQLWQSHQGEAPLALPPAWVVRLAPALASTLLIPLLGLVQWQLRPGRAGAALATSLITVTLLPLARHAHLAMLDGTQLSALALLWLGLLLAGEDRPKRCLLGGLLAGCATTAVLLLKAPLALPALVGALLLRRLDGRLGSGAWGWLLAGCALGLFPGLAWHLWHGQQRGDAALVMWGAQGFARVAGSVEGHGVGPLTPLIQVLIGGWPWLPLWPFGIVLAWRQRRLPWGLWSLGLTFLMSALVLPLRTQLPWYSLLLWPPFALVCGPVLASLAEGTAEPSARRWIPRLWLVLGVLLLITATASFIPGRPKILATVAPLAVPAGLGLGAGGWFLRRARRGRSILAVALLTLGWCLSLGLLFASPLWNWELNQTKWVRPVIALLAADRRGGERDGALPQFLDGEDPSRPSLIWYSDNRLLSLPEDRTPPLPRELLVISRAPASAARVREEQAMAAKHPDLHCRIDQAGADGWNRWLCHRRKGTP
jgi:4-amino-4-deoxy-L-arabinose transferase-like glycosyltransferase